MKPDITEIHRNEKRTRILALLLLACAITVGAIFGLDAFAFALMWVFCLVCNGSAVYFAYWWHRHLAGSVKVTGKIVRIENSQRLTYPYPEVQFVSGGKTHAFISRHVARAAQGIGTPVVVAYSVSSDRAEIFCFSTRWLCILGPGAGGMLVFFLLSTASKS